MDWGSRAAVTNYQFAKEGGLHVAGTNVSRNRIHAVAVQTRPEILISTPIFISLPCS